MSSPELVRKPASATNGGELDSSITQVIPGAKTFTGAETHTGVATFSGGAPILGRTDGVAVPANYIGQYITWVTPPGDMSLTSTVQDWPNATLILTPGVYLVGATVDTFLVGQSVAGGNSNTVTLTDSLNNVVRLLRANWHDASVTNTRVGLTSSFSMILTVTSAQTYKLRAVLATTNNGGAGSVINSNGGSLLYAFRIA